MSAQEELGKEVEAAFVVQLQQEVVFPLDRKLFLVGHLRTFLHHLLLHLLLLYLILHSTSFSSPFSCCCSTYCGPSCTSFPSSVSVILSDDVTPMMSVVRGPTVSESVAVDQLVDQGGSEPRCCDLNLKGSRSGSGSESAVKC